MHASPTGAQTRGFLLPFKIALATAAASDPTRVSLKSAERCLLCYLLQRVSAAAPQSPFRCRVDKLAAEFNVTTRSVHNWLTGLRDSGLLQFKQRRNHLGSFGLAAALTKQAVDLLGILENPLPRLKSNVQTHSNSNFEKNISDTDRPVNNLINIQPCGQLSKTVRGELPSDVKVLQVNHALTVPTVFWLMKQASMKSNRLGSILKIAGRYIDGKSPGAIKAYLMKCINSGRDYDAPTCYEQSHTVRDVEPREMLRSLSAEVERQGGRIAMRAGSYLIVDNMMLVRCRMLPNGTLEPAGVIAGETLRLLYERFSTQGDLS